MGSGAVLGAAPFVLIEQLIPIFSSVSDGSWDKPRSYKATLRSMAQTNTLLSSTYGTYGKIADRIEQFYQETPKYVFFRDNGLAGAEEVPAYRLSQFMTQKPQSGSGLWKRARVLSVEGTATGLADDPKQGYWLYLKPTTKHDTKRKQ